MKAILMYHSLDRSGSPISLAPDLFRRQMEWLVEAAVPVLPLRDIAAANRGVALTFDDAFANLIDYALPVLSRYRLPATIFAVSGFTGRNNAWPGQPAHIPRMRLMAWNDLRSAARAGVSVGAHTVNHPDLTTLDRAAQWREMNDSGREIEDRTGLRVTEFAYPYGASTQPLRDQSRERFEIACGTALRLLEASDDPADLPRIDAFYLNRFPLENLLTGRGRTYFSVRRLLRQVRKAVAA